MDASSDFMDMANATWNDFLDLNPNTVSTGERPSLTFLDNFTRNAGLVKSFDCATVEQRQVVLAYANQEATIHMDIIPITNPLASLSAQIVSHICEVATIKPRNSVVDITWSTAVECLCAEFFSPIEINRKLTLYWSIWHPNVNILHRPTFNPIIAKPVLVAAMVIIGAAVSPSESDQNHARFWFNAVEEMVFTDDDFCADESGDAFPALSKIQTLQAAYIVCLYQNWEGSDKSRRRIRRHRFSALVSVARDIGIQRAQYPDYVNLVQFDWLEFAAREQLIRVFLWIFLIDTAFVIFNNLPPRMVIKEMTCSLATCEAIFQAESGNTCYNEICRKVAGDFTSRQKSFITVGKAAELLCKDEVHEVMLEMLASSGPLNLFAITSSMHSMLFQYQNNFNAQSQLVPLRNALENWKMIWTISLQRYANTPDHAPLDMLTLDAINIWKRIGFMRYASEYWLLASLLLDRICTSEQGLNADDLNFDI